MSFADKIAFIVAELEADLCEIGRISVVYNAVENDPFLKSLGIILEVEVILVLRAQSIHHVLLSSEWCLLLGRFSKPDRLCLFELKYLATACSF